MWRRISSHLKTLSPWRSPVQQNLRINRSILISVYSSPTNPSPLRTMAPFFSNQASSDSVLLKEKKKVEDVMPIATGHEREELEAELEGKNLQDMDFPAGPFGTKRMNMMLYGFGWRKASRMYVPCVPNISRNLIAETDGAILTFLTLSRSSSSSTIQTLSLSILFNLSLNPNLKQLLAADMETIKHLNSIILSPSSPESGKSVASLICSLAMLDKNKAKFGVAGTIQALVRALDGPRSAMAHHLLCSLSELLQFHGNCTLAVWAGVVPILIGVLENSEAEDLAGTSLVVLGRLARFEEGINAIRNLSNGVVNLMVDMLKGRCMLSKEGSAEILLRLFDESEECLREAVRMPDLSSVLADLSVRGSAKAREIASLLMKKMVEADLDSYSYSETEHPMFYR